MSDNRWRDENKKSEMSQNAWIRDASFMHQGALNEHVWQCIHKEGVGELVPESNIPTGDQQKPPDKESGMWLIPVL